MSSRATTTRKQRVSAREVLGAVITVVGVSMLFV